ncbi:MAG: hypothetical protein ACAI35_28485 [Candidatus Methylacidiphilales bacterium]|nr:hypothetical protein [Candidatus Methylacidiphilales bacterium]
MKNILIFQSKSFDLTWPNVGSDGKEHPMGKDVAAFFQKKFLERGFKPTYIDEEFDGWEFNVEVLNIDYIVHVRFLTLGNALNDYWIVEPRKCVGFFQMFFGKKNTFSDCDPVIKALDAISRELPEVEDIQWIDTDQFEDYLRLAREVK